MGVGVRIPKVLHQIWLGPAPLPEEFARYRSTWAEHHPDWELRLWTEENLPSDLERREVYERLRQPAERSDILRLELLHRHGGVYVDTDVECFRPLDPLLDGVTFFVGRLRSGRINNAVVGSVPGHPLLERAIREIRPIEWCGTVDKNGTGPDFLHRIVSGDSTVTVFPTEVFFPQTPAERREAVAVHHQARSWKPEEDFRSAALMAERRLHRTQVELDDLERLHRETLAELATVRTQLASVRARLAGTGLAGRIAARSREATAGLRLSWLRCARWARLGARTARSRLR